MNDCKISFIICSNKEKELADCMWYLNRLKVPPGMEMEVIVINQADGLAKAYNQAMQESDAKYKVYLHQDVFIIHQEFIRDLISVFCSSADIGVIGMAGAEEMPDSGCWFDSQKQIGALMERSTGKMRIIQVEDFAGNYQEVDVVDGLLLATQYDVEWREDIFDGWHFYDVSCCYEFKQKGKKVVIPKQKQPWCVHWSQTYGVDAVYEQYQEKFVKEYLEN